MPRFFYSRQGFFLLVLVGGFIALGPYLFLSNIPKVGGFIALNRLSLQVGYANCLANPGQNFMVRPSITLIGENVIWHFYFI